MSTLTIEPSALDFGTVPLGDSVTLLVTVTNSTGSPVTLLAPPGDFAVVTTPGELAVDATVTVRLRYTPSAVGTDSESWEPLSGYTASLAGICVTADTKSNAAAFGTGEFDGDYMAVLPSALLLKVPNFAGGETVTIDGQATGMTSYLRVGAVPSSITSQYDLLTAYVDNPTGTEPTVSFPLDSGEDLARKVLTFTDERWYRGVTSELYFVDPLVRAAERAKLHTKGGWRDHSDGNRVTTTRGDKVEVIRGNHKLLVLGREQWASSYPSYRDAGEQKTGGLHSESSGGVSYDYDEVPGQYVDVKWVQSDGRWHVLEDTTTGHFVDRYHGKVKERCTGNVVLTEIGSSGAYDAQAASHSASSLPSYDSVDAASYTTDTLLTDLAAWSSETATLPSITELTWAKTVRERTWAYEIMDYDGSPDHPVPLIKEVVHANTVKRQVYADTITEHFHGSLTGDYLGDTTENWGLESDDMKFTEMFIGQYYSFRFGAAYTYYNGLAMDFRVGGSVDLRFGLLDVVSKLCIGSLDVKKGATADVHVGKTTKALGMKKITAIHWTGTHLNKLRIGLVSMWKSMRHGKN